MEFTIRMGRGGGGGNGRRAMLSGGRAKLAAAIAAVVMVGFLVLEWTVLRGEQVARLTVYFGATDAEKVLIDRVGERHLFEIDTRERRRGQVEGKAVKVRLRDPNGEVVHETAGWVTREKRTFAFTPKVAGSYELSVRPGGVLGGSTSGRAHVGVFVGDRRLLPRLASLLPF